MPYGYFTEYFKLGDLKDALTTSVLSKDTEDW